MGLLLPQLASPEAAWITVAEAAARSGLPERTIRHNARKWSALGRASRQTGEWLIAPAADDRFLATSAADNRAEVLDLRAVTAVKRGVANQRRQILADLDQYIARRLVDGVDRVKAIKEFADRFGRPVGDSHVSAYPVQFCWTTLYNWAKRNATAPASGLVDRRGLTGDTREPDIDVKHLFEQRWMTGNRIPLTVVFDEIVSYCDRKSRWCWGSYATFRRWVHATYPVAMQCLNRDGEDAYRQQHEPTLHQDPEAYAAGEMYVGDHHQLRHIVWYRGRLIRPWLTAWLDQRSLLYVGYTIVPSPNQCSILAAAKHACERYGPASKWLMDNGRDYSGYAVSGGLSRRCGPVLRAGYLDPEQISGLFAILQAQAIFCLPKSPNGKIIEGMFRPLEERFGRALTNYCGADPTDKPHDLARRIKSHPEIVPQFEEFAPVLGTWIDTVHNVRPMSGKYCGGRSPAEVFADKQTSRPQLADPRVLDLLDMQWSRPIPVRKGIRFANVVYGEWNPQVLAMHGEQVRVTYNPNDIASIGVWSLDYKFLFRADCEQLVNRNATDEDRREGFKVRAQLKKAMRIVRDDSYLDFASTAELAIAAQRDAAKRLIDQRPAGVGPASRRSTTVRVVQTPIDGEMNRVAAAFQPRLTAEYEPGIFDRPSLPPPPDDRDDDAADAFAGIPSCDLDDSEEDAFVCPQITQIDTDEDSLDSPDLCSSVSSVGRSSDADADTNADADDYIMDRLRDE